MWTLSREPCALLLGREPISTRTLEEHICGFSQGELLYADEEPVPAYSATKLPLQARETQICGFDLKQASEQGGLLSSFENEHQFSVPQHQPLLHVRQA